MKKRNIGADIVKNNQIKAVHDDDLSQLLKSLNVYDGVIEGEYRCLFCDNLITLDNIDSIVPHEGKVQFTCDEFKCHMKLIGWEE